MNPEITERAALQAAAFQKVLPKAERVERPKLLSINQAMADLKPGQRVAVERVVGNQGPQRMVLTGRVPYDGSTRQQRRAAERYGATPQSRAKDGGYTA